MEDNGVLIGLGIIAVSYLLVFLWGRSKGKSAGDALIAEAREIQRAAEATAKEAEDLISTAEVVGVEDESLVLEFDDSDTYTVALKDNYASQKAMRKSLKALNYQEWTITGARKSESQKFTKQICMMVLDGFDGQCDAIIAKVKWDNYAKSKTRIMNTFDKVNKAASVTKAAVAYPYLELKLRELKLTHERAEQVQREKEEQAAIREQMREEEKAQREAERALKEAAKEEEMYQKLLAKAQEEAGKDMSEELQAKIKELTAKLEESTGKKARAVSLAELTKRGHVYVISNIGSFGENVYKVGMTRRLDPQDRVKELGDASVPFQFDVHAMIYSEDAPALEKAMHEKLRGKEVNKVNLRKEFFNVSLDEIESIARENGVSVQFTKLAEAKEFYQSKGM